MDQKNIQQKIYAKIDELPTLPAVVPRLLSLVESEKSSATEVINVISRDPAITSKVLKVANSAYYGFSQQISDLRHAVALLGFKMVRSLALSIGIIQTFPSGKKLPNFSVEGLWLHSLSVATILQELGRRFGHRDANGSLFVVGLLHDIGKIALYAFFCDLFQKALEAAYHLEGTRLHLAEQKIIGIDHCQVAGMLLTRWKFPGKIVGPIAFHHHFEEAEEADHTDTAMLRIANIIAQELDLGDGGNRMVNDVATSDLRLLRMTDEDIDDMKAYSQSIKVEIQALFSAMT